MTNFRKSNLEQASNAVGTAVVIDVLRAFSAEAFAFGQGAVEIIAVGTVEEALALKAADPDLLVMGEVDGYPVSDFDMWNSPAELLRMDLSGRRLVHRTTAGTQGILASSGARQAWAASLVCARATAMVLREQGAEEVDFIITGQGRGRDGDEDAACADYITALLRGEELDSQTYIERVRRSTAGHRFLREEPSGPWLEDLTLCTEVDRFAFALKVSRENEHFIVRPYQPASFTNS